MRGARSFSTIATSMTLMLVAGCEATAVSTWETGAGDAALHPDSEQIAAGESLAELQIVDDVVMVVTRENDDVQVVDGAIHLKGDSAATSLLLASELLIEPATVGRSSEEPWLLVNGAGHELFSAVPLLMRLDEEAWTLSLQFELEGSESAQVLALTVAVQPYDENLNDKQSDANTTLVTDTTPPSTPPSISASGVSPSQVQVTWSASTDNVAISGYLIGRCLGAGCDLDTDTPLGFTTATSFFDTGRKGGTIYSYTVVAVDTAGNQSYAATASALTLTGEANPPSAPPSCSASAEGSSSQIRVTWSAATDDVGVAGYWIGRCLGASCDIDTDTHLAYVTTTSYYDTGLKAGTIYSYTVVAVDAAGNRSGAAGANAITAAGDTTAPSAPSGLSTSAVSSSQINLSWSASTDNLGVVGYRLERCVGSSCTSFAQIATPNTLSFSDTGLSASTTYRYRVRAVDVAGNSSAYSATASATTQSTADTTAPSAPTGLVASVVSASQINLSWTAASDNVGATGYRIERCTGSSCTSFAQIAATSTSTSLSNTGLSASTTYRYRVRAVDAAGNSSAYSSIASAITAAPADTSAPTTPSGLSACSIGTSRIDLNWSASSDNVGVSGYRIERCTGSSCTSFVQIATTTSRSFSSTGLSKYTTYRYRVRAVDAAGNLSGYSSIVSATTRRY